jgi:hypothetical protein
MQILKGYLLKVVYTVTATGLNQMKCNITIAVSGLIHVEFQKQG